MSRFFRPSLIVPLVLSLCTISSAAGDSVGGEDPVATSDRALIAALTSHRAAKIFLTVFGALYLADGALGLATGSGYLDFGILNNGILDLPFGFKVMANLPHIGLGGFAVVAARYLDRN